MPATTTSPVFYLDQASAWERALYAFLAEKQRRSGSRRTVEGYSRMLQDVFGRLGKPPDQVTGQEVFAWAHGRGASGKEPSAVTIGARMACLSSFYRFLIRMEMAQVNPCDALERPKVQPSPPRGLSVEQIRRLLASIPETRSGLRDRAIVLTLTLTGRRRTEVLELRRGDLLDEGGTFYYSYRGKGGKRAKRELPRPAVEAIAQALAAWGKSLEGMAPEESLWPTGRQRACGGRAGDNERHLLRQLAALPQGGGACPRRACTSSGTRRQSCVGTRVSRSKTCPAFSTTAAWP